MTTTWMLNFLLGSGVLTTVCRILISRMKKNEAKTEAVCLGVQALLRDRLYQTYNESVDRGYAPISVKENFENMYKQYHSLGANGVMDELHDKFKDLPTEQKER